MLKIKEMIGMFVSAVACHVFIIGTYMKYAAERISKKLWL
jgi:hypothetical protein